MRAQGATEYLVLLAVVLVIALVGIALLGFFPGTASDAQIAESQIYWQSASPIAITDWAVKVVPSSPNVTAPYVRIRNVGAAPVRITKMLGANASINQFYTGAWNNFQDYYYLAPGEEAFFGSNAFYSLPQNRDIGFLLIGGDCSNNARLCGATSICQGPPSPGTLVINGFGFEYIQYVEGQQITKRQIGTKPLMIKCT